MNRFYGFLIFISIAITIYGLINFYIFIRGLQAIPSISPVRPWFIYIFWSFVLSYLVGRFAEHIALSWFSDTLIWIGSFWFGAMVYFFLILLAIDLLRLVNYIVPFFPAFITQNSQYVKQTAAFIVAGIVILVLAGGHINTLFPRIKKLELTINKDSRVKELNVVVATDIHLGTIICKKHFTRIVDEINSLDPDIVLFAGDLVDEDIRPVIRQNLGETLRLIKSKHGIYGITGNHEYIGGVEEACEYLTDHGVVMLRDSVVKIADSFMLIGREDVSIRQFTGKQRKPLADLMGQADTSLPVILMDHQPLHLEDAVRNKVDLQLSGHTHDGQLWPFKYIAQAVYELSWGYKKKENTHIYVSCGVGTWGPPMRIGNSPEIINFRLKFER